MSCQERIFRSSHSQRSSDGLRDTSCSWWGQNQKRLILQEGFYPSSYFILECHAGFFWRCLKKNWVGPKGRPARSLKHLDWQTLCFLTQDRYISQSIRLRRLLSGKKISWFKFPLTFVSVALCCLRSSMQPQGSWCPFPADISVPTVVSCTLSTEPPFSFHSLGSGSQRASKFL